MDGSLKASTQDWERLGKEGQDTCAGEVQGWGGFREDADCGGHGGERKRVMEGCLFILLSYFHLLLSSEVAGLKQGAVEGGGGSALGRVKPTAVYPRHRVLKEALDAGLQKAGCFLRFLPEHPPGVLLVVGGKPGIPLAQPPVTDVSLQGCAKGKGAFSRFQCWMGARWGALFPRNSQLGFPQHLQLLGQSAVGVCITLHAHSLGCDDGGSGCGNAFHASAGSWF